MKDKQYDGAFSVVLSVRLRITTSNMKILLNRTVFVISTL